jgi:hypothetical protein
MLARITLSCSRRLPSPRRFIRTKEDTKTTAAKSGVYYTVSMRYDHHLRKVQLFDGFEPNAFLLFDWSAVSNEMERSFPPYFSIEFDCPARHNSSRDRPLGQRSFLTTELARRLVDLILCEGIRIRGVLRLLLKFR